MGIIWAIIIGFFVGLLARAIMPGRQKMGMFATVLLGIVGAVGATWGGQLMGMYAPGEKAGFLASLVGAMVVLWVYGEIKKRR